MFRSEQRRSYEKIYQPKSISVAYPPCRSPRGSPRGSSCGPITVFSKRPLVRIPGAWRFGGKWCSWPKSMRTKRNIKSVEIPYDT